MAFQRPLSEGRSHHFCRVLWVHPPQEPSQVQGAGTQTLALSWRSVTSPVVLFEGHGKHNYETAHKS